MKVTVLKKYAELIARSGAAVKKGDDVIIVAELDQPKFVEYVVDSAWTELEDGVYYIQVDAETASAGKSYSVLNGDVVTVNKLATAEHFALAQMNGNIPSITFTAYAVQAESFVTAADAWTQAKTLG